MAKFSMAVRIIYGLLWVVFGVNFFLQFLPNPPPPESMVKIMEGFLATGYLLKLAKMIEITVGICLVFNVFVPLALILIAPITVNILMIHLFVEPSGLPIAIFMIGVNIFLASRYGSYYKPLLKIKSESK